VLVLLTDGFGLFRRERLRLLVIGREGRRVAFDVAAKDEIKLIGGGAHARFVVDVAKKLERVKAKAAKHRTR
jgi:predicted thioesterase